MKCKKCGRDCLEEEIIEGYCLECVKKHKNNFEELKVKENKIAEIYRLLAVIILGSGIFISLVILTSNISDEYAIKAFIITVGWFLLLIGFAEIIQLLEDIKNK